jgi:hypothetical protein
METLRTLPNLEGRRFGVITIGYDRIEQIRTELSVLESLAAVLCNCDREALTVPMVQRLTAAITNRVQAVTDADIEEIRGENPIDLVARAVALMQRGT